MTINKYRPFVGEYDFKFVYDIKNRQVIIKRKYLNQEESDVDHFLPDLILNHKNVFDPDMQEILKGLNTLSYLKIFSTINQKGVRDEQN